MQKQKVEKSLPPATKPEVYELLNGYDCFWEQEDIRIKITRLDEHSDGLQGEIEVTMASDGGYIYGSKFNFSSNITRKSLSNSLLERVPDCNWPDMLEQICYKIIKLFRRGEPMVEISSTDEIKKPEYLLYPFILKNEMSMLFGDGGSCKSTMALYCAAIGATGMGDKKLKFELKKPFKTLYLDWEAHEDILKWRWHCIIAGLGLDGQSFKVFYRPCCLPLVDDVEQIQNYIEDCEAELIIIDSIGAATGGEDINKAMVATSVMNAIRRLKTTAFIIHHTSKMQGGRPTPFGSVYFNNSNRNAFYAFKSEQEGENIITVGYTHEKHNYTGKLNPLAARITFGDMLTTVDSVNPKTVPDFMDKLPIIQQLEYALLDNGSMTVMDISKLRHLPEDVVLRVLSSNPKMFVEILGTKSGDITKWGLISNREDIY